MPKVTVEFNISANKEEFEDICQKNLINIPNCTLSATSTGFIVAEEKTDLLNGTYPATANISYSNGLITINSKCGGIGPFQKKHVAEFTEIIKNIIERSISERQSGKEISSDIVRCPKCGSTQIQLQKRGWTLSTGLIGSSKNERICMNCLYKF